jgi:hypothetical protein
MGIHLPRARLNYRTVADVSWTQPDSSSDASKASPSRARPAQTSSRNEVAFIAAHAQQPGEWCPPPPFVGLPPLVFRLFPSFVFRR